MFELIFRWHRAFSCILDELLFPHLTGRLNGFAFIMFPMGLDRLTCNWVVCPVNPQGWVVIKRWRSLPPKEIHEYTNGLWKNHKLCGYTIHDQPPVRGVDFE